jgi:hypothetical protein
MIDVIRMRSVQIYEFLRTNGWSSFFREVVYRRRKAIVVKKTLCETRDRTEELRQRNVEFVEIDQESLVHKKYQYRFKNRYLKALHYLGKGYGGHAIVKEGEIIGDIWYFAPDKSPDGHRDPQWLDIQLSNRDIYSFDIFLIPAERGNNFSALLQNNAMHALCKKGYENAFAFYWADNIPAVWNTRVINKWKELKTLRMNRFLFFRKRAGCSDMGNGHQGVNSE